MPVSVLCLLGCLVSYRPLADHFSVLGEVSGELSPASVYVGLLPVGEACVVACWSRPGFELINDYRDGPQ